MFLVGLVVASCAPYLLHPTDPDPPSPTLVERCGVLVPCPDPPCPEPGPNARPVPCPYPTTTEVPS